MLAQISFKAPQKIKKTFSDKAKDQGISMSALFLTFMEEYAFGNIKMWLVTTINNSNSSDIEVLHNPPKDIQKKMDKIAKISWKVKSNK